MQHSRAPGPLPDRRAPVIGTAFYLLSTALATLQFTDDRDQTGTYIARGRQILTQHSTAVRNKACVLYVHITTTIATTGQSA
jgi:hypothetical protein